jgi:hypothetical protein
VAAGRAWRPKPTAYAGQAKRPSRISVFSLESCPSGKRGYVSKSAAKRDVRQVQTRGAPIERVYRCLEDGCAQWHLTSTPLSTYWKRKQAWSE